MKFATIIASGLLFASPNHVSGASLRPKSLTKSSSGIEERQLFNDDGNQRGSCGVVVPDPMNNRVTHDEQCRRYLGTELEDQACFFNGRRGEPCVLDYGNDKNPRWMDKDPSACMGDTFYLWDEPWTDRAEMNPPQSTERGCWSQAGRDWAAYVEKWSTQLKAARERGMKVTTPQGKWGPIDRYLDEFFQACNDADGGCDDPTSEGYMDIIGINAFCGDWNRGCSSEGGDYCCDVAANWVCNEIIGKDYDRPVYMTNWSALGLRACREIQYRAMQAVPILLDCPAIERVYWYSAYMWDDTRLHCEEENYLDKQLASTGTTLGQEWAKICAEHDGNPVSNPHSQTRSEPAPVQSEAVADAAETCDDVWGNDADGHTCGKRIEWVRDNQGKSLEAAKRQVAHEQPAACGACA